MGVKDSKRHIEVQRVDDLRDLLSSIRDSSELYYLSLLILSSQIGSKSVLPELLFLLDERSVNKLLFYYGGEEIRIPTISEFRDQLYGILIYYYYDIQGNSWKKSIELMGIEYSGELSYKLGRLRKDVIDSLRDIKVPNAISERSSR